MSEEIEGRIIGTLSDGQVVKELVAVGNSKKMPSDNLWLQLDEIMKDSAKPLLFTYSGKKGQEELLEVKEL